MSEPIEIVSGGKEFLDAIEPLWEMQRALHRVLSTHFGESIGAVRFADRRVYLCTKADGGGLRVDLARIAGETVGYCVSTIDEHRTGEIDSLFIAEEHRGSGVGSALMKVALAWLDGAGVKKKIVCVAIGNDRALKFYERFGFLPRITVAEQA